jgi:RND family efflux transporter MFP subunit
MRRISNLLLLILPLLVSCKEGSRKKEISKTPIAVEVVYVDQVQNALEDNYVGEIVASESVLISARHIGTMESINVRQGSVVKQGDVLGHIDSKNTKSSYEISQATLRQAEDGYERVKKVHATGTVADIKLIEIETAVAKARAMAAASAESLEECNVKAPFAGTISNVFIEKGVDVSLGTPLFKLVDISTIEIKIYVPEAEIGSIKLGKKARVEIPALNLSNVEAELTSKGVVATTLSHTYECVLKITSPVNDLMPGMVCKVFMAEENGQPSIVIPASSIETGTNGRYVWVVKDGIVAKQNVTVGGYKGKGVVISSGLQVGDAVIVEGAAKVSTGMEVKINNSK